jgi:acetylornithine deacetylase/succinyl-diaminopimelate desuccinylase-like protein
MAWTTWPPRAWHSDDFMGPLTLSPNLIREKDGKVDVLVNVRMPRGNTPEALSQATTERIKAWGARLSRWRWSTNRATGWRATPRARGWPPAQHLWRHHRAARQPVPTAGSTTAKLMPNAINFGPAMPGKKYTAHNAKEFKEVADLDADMQMFTEMLVRIGNLQQMQ